MARLYAADDFAAIRSRMEELQRARERAAREKALEPDNRSPSFDPTGEQVQRRRPIPERTRSLGE
jgi:hypothetical protein